MIFKVKGWSLFFQIDTIIASIATGLLLLLLALRNLDTLLWFIIIGIAGLLAIMVGVSTFNSTITSASVDKGSVELTYLLNRKRTIPIKSMAFGDVKYIWTVSPILEVNEGPDAVTLDIRLFDDWKAMVTELEKTSGVKIPGQEGVSPQVPMS